MEEQTAIKGDRCRRAGRLEEAREDEQREVMEERRKVSSLKGHSMHFDKFMERMKRDGYSTTVALEMWKDRRRR